MNLPPPSSRFLIGLLALTAGAWPLQADNNLRTPLGSPLPAKDPQVKVEVARAKLRDNMDKKVAEFMKLHNDARSEVGVPPLTWDAGIAAYAQEWAEKIAADDRMEHRPDGKYGENLAGYLPAYGERPVHGAQMWYEEIKDYRGEKMDGENYKKVGHYTQMVWRKSTRVGFGVAMTKNGMVMLCANYETAGNMQGEHPYNVDGQPAVKPAVPAAVTTRPKVPSANAADMLGGGEEVGGMNFKFPPAWQTKRDNDTVTSASADGSARVIITKIPLPADLDSPWDKIQADMPKVLAPLLPGLADLEEVNTEHDVVRCGVGMRVVTYTAKSNGRPVDVITDFARENNVDGGGLVLIVRSVPKGSKPLGATALAVVDSLRFKK